MKRIIIALLLVLTLVICLPSCNQTGKNPLDTVNTLAQNASGNYTIEIQIASLNGDKVTERYTVTEVDGTRSVSYRIEKINSFVIDGENITVPDDYMTVNEGVYSVEESASSEFDLPSFNFTTAALSSVITEEGKISASLSSTEDFMGAKLVGTGFTVSVNYTETAITSIVISYVTSFNNNVTVTYTLN
jgi:hypothetical protein